MGRTNLDEIYLNAFNAAVAQREQIYAEAERLKSRRALLETAARALEPIIYPDEYLETNKDQASSSVVEIGRPAPSPEVWNPTLPVEVHNAPSKEPQEQRPVQAVTQVYVRGDGEPDEEIQRRISIAIGRSAAD